MNIDFEELKDWRDGARSGLKREMDRLREKEEQISDYMRALDATDELLSEIDDLNEVLEKRQTENDNLRQQLQEEKEQRQALEMRLSELSKLSAGVAKKSSQDDLIKAIRIFVNKSKHKRMEKRMAVKEMVLELAYANGIVFPEDLAATLDSLDDEQTEPKVVNVSGSYNDIHDNGEVKVKS